MLYVFVCIISCDKGLFRVCKMNFAHPTGSDDEYISSHSPEWKRKDILYHKMTFPDSTSHFTLLHAKEMQGAIFRTLFF